MHRPLCRRSTTCLLGTGRLAHTIAVPGSPSQASAAVSRRADPRRIQVARRTAVRNLLADDGMPVETADAWCDAWEAEADRLGLEPDSEYWTLGIAWIGEQRKERKLPT